MIGKMITIETEALPDAAAKLDAEEIAQLVRLLSEKEDNIRYQAFLLLQHRSRLKEDVYPYWDEFRAMLKSDNSYHRTIGLTLIADNARWDHSNRLSCDIDAYLMLLQDEKPITARLCIQSLQYIIPYKPELHEKIINRLLHLDLLDIRETMRKLVLMDILNIVMLLRKERSSPDIEKYISDALMGEILDKKSKKLLEAML